MHYYTYEQPNAIPIYALQGTIDNWNSINVSKTLPEPL